MNQRKSCLSARLSTLPLQAHGTQADIDSSLDSVLCLLLYLLTDLEIPSFPPSPRLLVLCCVFQGCSQAFA